MRTNSEPRSLGTPPLPWEVTVDEVRHCRFRFQVRAEQFAELLRRDTNPAREIEVVAGKTI
jgi:hypothetical protein